MPDPGNHEANLLLAIALLRGRNPDTVSRRVIQQAERCALNAAKSSRFRAVAMAVLGVIKYDHYLANGMSEGEPSIEEIKQNLERVRFADEENELLSHIDMSRRAKEILKTIRLV